MATRDELIISSDADAAQVLQDVLRNQLSLAPDQQIKMQGWPTVEIRLTGPNYDGTITAATAKALVELQHAADQAYLNLVRPSGRRLTDAEKSRTAITAKVEKGSSLLTVDFSEFAKTLATDLVQKMSSTDILIAVLGLGMIAGASVVFKQYLRSRAATASKEKELQAQLAMSEQETKRLEVVTQAMTRQPKLAIANDDFDDARDALLRSAADAKTLTVDGLTLTGEQSARLPRQPRAKSEQVQLNGVYLITSVSWSNDDYVELGLRSTGGSDTLEMKATLTTRSLLQADKDLLAAAEWNRTPVYLSINAKTLRGEVVDATIVGFDWEAVRNRRG